MSTPLLLAIDQGTSATKTLLVGLDGRVHHVASVPIGIAHPRPGWVEQDAEEIWASVTDGIGRCLEATDEPVVAVAVSAQRESALLWDKATSRPLGPVVGWQDRRTSAAVAALGAAGHGDLVRARTGLPLDPMFSATKLRWLLDSLDRPVGNIAAGTVDSWIVHRLTGEHRIEAGHAGRTQLLDLATGDWAPDLLDLFGIPLAILPEVVASTSVSGPITGIPELAGRRVTGVLADSHAALFAQGLGGADVVKATYGTGTSVMGLLPADPAADDRAAAAGLVTTIAWRLDAGEPATLAAEGNILSSGATVAWLAGVLGVTPGEVFDLAERADPESVAMLVPAFRGLGAPWWDDTARAVLTGFDLGTGRAEIARAAVESMTRQVEDVLAAMDHATGARVEEVFVDGGPTRNARLMQNQADVSRRRVVRSDVAELSAVGAALCAALGSGEATLADLSALRSPRTVVEPIDGADAGANPGAAAWAHALGLARGGRPADTPDPR